MVKPRPHTAPEKRPPTPNPKEVVCPHQHFKYDIIDRDILSRRQHLNLLCTPKGYRWVILKGVTEDLKDPDDFAHHPCRLVKKKPGKTYVHNILSELWSLLTPEMVARLKEMLMAEFGLTEEAAVDFICQSRQETLQTAHRLKRKRKEEDESEEENDDMPPEDPTLPRLIIEPKLCEKSQFAVGIDPCHIREFSRIVSAKFSEYVVAMMCARRNNRHRRMAEVVLNGLCNLTGEKTTLDNPKNRLHKILALTSDRVALWLAKNMESGDYERDKRRRREDEDLRRRKLEKQKEQERRQKEKDKMRRDIERNKKRKAQEEAELAKRKQEEQDRKKSEKEKRRQEIDKFREEDKKKKEEEQKKAKEEEEKRQQEKKEKEEKRKQEAKSAKQAKKDDKKSTASKEQKSSAGERGGRGSSGEDQAKRGGEGDEDEPGAKGSESEGAERPTEEEGGADAGEAGKGADEDATSTEGATESATEGATESATEGATESATDGGTEGATEGAPKDAIVGAKETPDEPEEGGKEGEQPGEDQKPDEKSGQEPGAEPEASKTEEDASKAADLKSESQRKLEESIVSLAASQIIDTKPVATPRQEALKDILSKDLEKRVEPQDQETADAIKNVAAKTATWIDQNVKDAEIEYGTREVRETPITQKPKGPLFVVKKIESGPSDKSYDIRLTSHLDAGKRIRAARRKGNNQNPPTSAPTDTSDPKMWAKWAVNASQMADDWGHWIDKTIQDVEDKTVQYQSKAKEGKAVPQDVEDWNKFVASTTENALSWRRKKKYFDEEAKEWKLNSR